MLQFHGSTIAAAYTYAGFSCDQVGTGFLIVRTAIDYLERAVTCNLSTDMLLHVAGEDLIVSLRLPRVVTVWARAKLTATRYVQHVIKIFQALSGSRGNNISRVRGERLVRGSKKLCSACNERVKADSIRCPCCKLTRVRS